MKKKNIKGQSFDLIEKFCIFAIPIVVLITRLLRNIGSNLICFTLPIKELLPVLISFVISLFYYFASPSIQNKSDANLKGEKDEYLIWGAIGSLALTLVKEANCIFNNSFGISIIFASFHLLLLIAIHYRRLSSEIYRREEIKKQRCKKMMIRALSRICKDSKSLHDSQEIPTGTETILPPSPTETEGGKRYTLSVEKLLPK